VPKACALRLRPGLSARQKLLDFRNRASHARLSSHFRGGGSGAGAISRVVDKIVQARREFAALTFFIGSTGGPAPSSSIRRAKSY
jgi:hypothetical protein